MLLLTASLSFSPEGQPGRLLGSIAAVERAGLIAQDLSIDLRIRSDGSGALLATATQVAWPAWGTTLGPVTWRCPLVQGLADWACAGSLTVARKPAGSLLVRSTESGIALDWQQGESRLLIARADTGEGRDSGTGMRVSMTAIPLHMVAQPLAHVWPDAKPEHGTFSGTFDVSSGVGTKVAGELQVNDLTIDTADGSLAVAGLAGNLDLAFDSRSGSLTASGAGELTAGEVLAGPFYAKLPDAATPVTWLIKRTDDVIRIDEFSFHEPGVLDFQAAGRYPVGQGPLDGELDIQMAVADAARAVPRWFGSLLATAGFPEATGAGQARFDLTIRQRKVTDIDAHFDDFDFGDQAGRFAFAGVDGELALSSTAQPRRGRLEWQAAVAGKLNIGASAFDWQSANGSIALAEPAHLPLAGGILELTQLAFAPERTSESDRGSAAEDVTGSADGGGLTLAGALRDVDVATLAAAFGLPHFEGRLTGRIPQAHWANDRLTVGGRLSVAVFAGCIFIDQLIWERPFGIAPVIGGDVRLENLDLAQLTSVLDFGQITGRLDGTIANLRVVDGSPVAFDASLVTDRKAGVRQRISQRAVRNLTEVGGGGIGGGLQTFALRFFDDFGYRRIGLSCRLADDICQMGGLQRDGAGYTIVEGAGLPRLTVNGFQREVAWPTLIERLQAVTSGASSPIVQ